MESICSISLDLKGRRDTKWVKSGGMRCKGGVSQIGRAVVSEMWSHGDRKMEGQSACPAPGWGKRAGERLRVQVWDERSPKW